MDIIENYKEPQKKKNLVYLAKPIYGGWVTFTAHLSKKYDYPIYKITKRTEGKKRNYGYDCEYQNMNITDIIKLDNLLITAVDKHYWGYLKFFPKDTEIVIHDPTECKPAKEINPLIQSKDGIDPLLSIFQVRTIRESVQDYLIKTFDFQSEFLFHPFHEYQKIKVEESSIEYENVSISRIDFDKNTDIILNANQLIQDESKKIYCFGAENRIYVHHKLKDLGIDQYWKGKFPKDFEPKYEGKSILKNAKYMIDMSIIKKDGGGTQYTFLEAIYQDCVLVLHDEWISKGDLFESGVNCIGISNAKELADFIMKGLSEKKRKEIVANSKNILEDHFKIQW
jgi:hypothetical protein